MKRLAYISAASPALDLPDLEAIMEAAIRHNGKADITGVLLYNGLNFLQVLEGDPTAIATIYTEIIADGRHSGVVTILDELVEQRIFPQWSMQLAIVPSAVGALPTGMNLSTDFLQGLPTSVPDHIRNILSGFNSMSQIRRD